MRIAVLRPAGGLGDVTMALSPVQSLAAQGHQVGLTILKGYVPLVEAVGLTDKIKVVGVPFRHRRGRDQLPDARHWPYLRELGDVDRWIDLFCPAFRAEKHSVREDRLPPSRLRTFCEAAGTEARPVSIAPRPEWLHWAEGWLTAMAEERWRNRLIIIHPIATTWRRSWPVSQWKRLVEDLQSWGWIVVGLHSCWGPRVWRSEPHFSAFGAIPFVGHSFQRVIGLMSWCSYFVGVDSGWLHVAAAMRKRSLGIFGPTGGTATCELYPTTHVAEGNSCDPPCYLISEKFRRKCYRPKAPHTLCIRFPSYSQVRAKLEDLLGQRSLSPRSEH